MTRDEATDILTEWGRYLETTHASLLTIFFLGKIPASFLPFDYQMLEDAINLLAKYHFDIGDYEMSDFIKSTLGPAFLYCEDREAVEHFFKFIDMPEFDVKQTMLDKLREYRATH